MEGISEPKKIISLSWDDPWRKYEEKFKKNPKGEDALLVSDLPRSERKRRNRKTRCAKKSESGGIQWKSSRQCPSKDAEAFCLKSRDRKTIAV